MKKRRFKLVLLGLLLLTSCHNNKPVTTYEHSSNTTSSSSSSSLIKQSEYPLIKGVKDISIEYGDVFNPLKDISAVDIYGNDISSKLKIEGVEKIKIINNHVFSLGNHVLRYYLDDNSLLAQEYMVLTVNYSNDNNLIKNQTFKFEDLFWQFENIEYNFNNNELTIKSIDDKQFSFITQKSISLKANKVYNFTFTAKASSNIELEVDFIRNNKSIKMGFDTKFTITNSIKMYDFTFINQYDADDINLVFNLKIPKNETVSIIAINLKEEKITSDKTPPTIIGVNDKQILLNTLFDPLLGVSAVDDVDGDVSLKITYTLPNGATKQGNLVKFSTLGEYSIIYRVSDESGNESIKTRIIKVLDGIEDGINLLTNGDFLEGLTNVYTDNNEGSNATFSVAEQNLIVQISALPSISTSPFPRVIFGKVPNSNFNDGLVFEENQNYELSFTLKVDDSRNFVIQIGELYTQAPWINSFTSEIVVSATKEYVDYKFSFKMNKATNTNGMVSFCFGNTNQANAIATTFYLKNVSLIKKG